MGTAGKKKGKGKNNQEEKALEAGGEKEIRTRILLDTPDGKIEAEEAYDDDSAGGMFLGKEDVKLIYNALCKYTPTKDEEHMHSVWLEMFEEILVVDYGEAYPDAN